MAILNKEEQKLTKRNSLTFNTLHRCHSQDSFCALCENDARFTAIAMAAILHTLSILGIILPIIIVRLIT